MAELTRTTALKAELGVGKENLHRQRAHQAGRGGTSRRPPPCILGNQAREARNAQRINTRMSRRLFKRLRQENGGADLRAPRVYIFSACAAASLILDTRI